MVSTCYIFFLEQVFSLAPSFLVFKVDFILGSQHLSLHTQQDFLTFSNVAYSSTFKRSASAMDRSFVIHGSGVNMLTIK
jgi:hypothetical protein